MVYVLPLHSFVWESDWFRLCSILDLYVLLSSREDVPHPGDFMLYQVFAERAKNLQPIDEHCSNHVAVAFIHQVHLALEITDMILEALSRLHLNCKEVIAFLLSSRREAYW